MSKEDNKKNEHDIRNLKAAIHSAIWIIAWAGTWATTAWFLKFKWQSADLLAILLIVVNVAVGLGMVVFYIRLLNTMDELMKKIQFDALAYSLGAALIGGVGLTLMEVVGYIEEAKAAYVLCLICVTYSIGSIVGLVRYR